MYLSDILKQARFMTNLIAKISRCITAPFIATMRCHNHYLTFLRVLRFRNYPPEVFLAKVPNFIQVICDVIAGAWGKKF